MGRYVAVSDHGKMWMMMRVEKEGEARVQAWAREGKAHVGRSPELALQILWLRWKEQGAREHEKRVAEGLQRRSGMRLNVGCG